MVGRPDALSCTTVCAQAFVHPLQGFDYLRPALRMSETEPHGASPASRLGSGEPVWV